MTPSQRKLYFRLWPAACKVQGWDSKDDARRHAVTKDATGKSSASSLTQSQISALFDHLKWLADPYSLEAALPAACPEIGEENHRRRQLVWRITQTAAKAGLNQAWLAQAAAAKCQEHRVCTWQELPLPELLKFSFTVSSRTATAAQDRRFGRAVRRVQDDCSAFIPELQPDPEFPF